ncbi:MAG: hypothetical protein AB1750_00355 [Chloroflexota bacterium]
MKRNLPLALILLGALLAFALLTKDHEWGDDWASYVMQAVTITKGDTREFMVRNAFTMRESTHFLGPDAYPWGFPAFLAPFTLVCGPLNVFCLKFANLIFFALFLWALHAFLARRLPPLETNLILALFAVSPVLLQYVDIVQSDIAFLFFSTLALILVERVNNSLYEKFLLGLVIFLAFFVRTNGLLLLPTLFLTQAFAYFRTQPRLPLDPKRILSPGLIPYIVFGLLALANFLLFPAGEGLHLARLSAISPASLAANLSMYFSLPAAFFDSLPHSLIIYGILLPFFLGGAAIYFKRDFHIVAYILLSFGLFILWPETQGIRFLFPLLPFLVYFAYQGMTATSFALTERYQRAGQWLTRGFWLVILAAFAWTSLSSAYNNLAQGRGPYGNVLDPLSVKMFGYIRLNTPEDSVVAFYKPRALRLFTGRDALLIDTCDALPKADFVVLRKSRGAVDQIAPNEIETCNPSVQVSEVFDNEKFVVYKISPK